MANKKKPKQQVEYRALSEIRDDGVFEDVKKAWKESFWWGKIIITVSLIINSLQNGFIRTSK